mmetsp:Transcript_22569/g.69748  ORF Transcript_22569/g.69748 Transcript_22569/m.69748 type:complete len:281 (+) Transcript_22569:49-891(+)
MASKRLIIANSGRCSEHLLGEEWVDALAPVVAVLAQYPLGGRLAGLHRRLEALQKAGLLEATALQAALGDAQHLARDVLHGAAAEGRLEAQLGHVQPHRLHLLERDVLRERQRLGLRLAVVQQPHPQRRQRTDAPPRPAVGAAHLDIALEPHFREGDREVILVVHHCGALARQRLQLARHEVSEALARAVDVLAVPVGKVHGHVQNVVHPALKAEGLVEHKGQLACAVRVGVRPNLRAVALKAVGLAVCKGRIGEKRGCHRLQRDADAHLLHHVLLALKV